MRRYDVTLTIEAGSEEDARAFVHWVTAALRPDLWGEPLPPPSGALLSAVVREQGSERHSEEP